MVEDVAKTSFKTQHLSFTEQPQCYWPKCFSKTVKASNMFMKLNKIRLSRKIQATILSQSVFCQAYIDCIALSTEWCSKRYHMMYNIYFQPLFHIHIFILICARELHFMTKASWHWGAWSSPVMDTHSHFPHLKPFAFKFSSYLLKATSNEEVFFFYFRMIAYTEWGTVNHSSEMLFQMLIQTVIARIRYFNDSQPNLGVKCYLYS